MKRARLWLLAGLLLACVESPTLAQNPEPGARTPVFPTTPREAPPEARGSAVPWMIKGAVVGAFTLFCLRQALRA